MSQKEKKDKKILYFGLDPSRYSHQGELVHFPLIQTVPRPFSEMKMYFENLGLYTHILFTSRTAVSIFVDYAKKSGFALNALKSKCYISLGKATQKKLEEFGLSAHFRAQDECGEGVVALLETIDFQGEHLFFPHSAIARKIIPTYLQKRGVKYTAVALYDTIYRQVELPDLEQFDEIVFTSPSTVKAFFSLQNILPPMQKCKASGPITNNFLRSYKRGKP